MPSYTVTYGDDNSSRPSNKFANPAHGIMGVLGTSGSDPRERGRKRSRSEIEAASRAEYLAKKEHLAKVKEMRDAEKSAEAEKKTSKARAKVLARPDVQAELDRKEEMRLSNEARKNKPLERLTPEQSLAKGQAEKRQREAVAAGPQFSTYADSPQAKESEEFLYRLGFLPDGRMPDGGNHYGRPDGAYGQMGQNMNALRQAALIPSSMFDNNRHLGQGTKQSYLNNELNLMRRIQKYEKKRAEQDAEWEASKQQASAPAAPTTPAAPAAPAASVKLMRGMAPQQFTNSGPEFRAALEEQFRNPNGKEQMPTPHQLYTRGNAGQGPTMAGVKKFGSDVGESLRGIKDAVDSGAGALIEASVPQFNRANRGAVNLGENVAKGIQSGVDAAVDLDRRVSPYVDQGADAVATGLSNLFDQSATQFDRANAGAAKIGEGVADAGRRVSEWADKPLAEGGLRFDPGVPMPKQREVGGATGGSIGAPTAPRQGVQPTMFESLVGLLPQASPQSMSSTEASRQANDAWRAEMARAEEEASTFGPPAPKKPKKK